MFIKLFRKAKQDTALQMLAAFNPLPAKSEPKGSPYSLMEQIMTTPSPDPLELDLDSASSHPPVPRTSGRRKLVPTVAVLGSALAVGIAATLSTSQAALPVLAMGTQASRATDATISSGTSLPEDGFMKIRPTNYKFTLAASVDTLGDKLPVWKFSQGDQDALGIVSHAASVFGISDPAVKSDPNSGFGYSAPRMSMDTVQSFPDGVLTVSKDGALTYNFSNDKLIQETTTVTCDDTGVNNNTSPDGTSPSSAYCLQTPTQSTSGGISASEAISKTMDYVNKLGIKQDGFSLKPVVQEQDGSTTTTVMLNLVSDAYTMSGLYTFSFNDDGSLLYSNGPLASLTKVGEYPTISTKEALPRLNDPRWNSSPFMYAADTMGGVMLKGAATGSDNMGGDMTDSAVAISTPEVIPVTPADAPAPSASSIEGTPAETSTPVAPDSPTNNVDPAPKPTAADIDPVPSASINPEPVPTPETIKVTLNKVEVTGSLFIDADNATWIVPNYTFHGTSTNTDFVGADLSFSTIALEAKYVSLPEADPVTTLVK